MKIKGELSLPGDKSISHRAVLFSSLYKGITQFLNFPSSADCLATLDCLKKLGINWTLREGALSLQGAGRFGYVRPDDGMLDARNSGTTIRLLAGILAAQRFSSTIAGDKHLNRRPMERILVPLRRMGAQIEADEGSVAPLTFHSVNTLNGIEYDVPVASAQVKSCVLLSGLHAGGETVVIEKQPTRDHTERMLGLKVVESEDQVKKIYSNLEVEISDLSMHIPGDISSAAFFLVAALLLPGSELLIKNVSLNPTRTGILDVLKKMGTKLEIRLKQSVPEPMGDIYITAQNLKNIHLEGAMIPVIIDEIPVLTILALQSEGEFSVRGAGELRVKESDRIQFICQNLRQLGIKLEEFEDGFAFQAPQLIKGGRIITGDDHRIAMAFAVAGLMAKGEIVMDNPDCVKVSFPDFWQKLSKLCGRITS
jgi:3-phosphoshikimate 1-carboxyvinyltransferase